MNRTSAGVIGAVLVFILILAAVATYSIRQSSVERERNEAARSLLGGATTATYTDLDGNKIDLTGPTTEQPLVVTTWASWCPQCADELSLINRVVGETDPPLKVLALNRQEPKEQATRFLNSLPQLQHITYVLDNDDHYFTSIEGYAMPETIVYSAQGEVLYHKRGNFTEDELRSALMSATQ